MLFVTHFHSDHVLGVVELVAKRNRAVDNQWDGTGTIEEWRDKNKVFLVVPYSLAPWVDTIVKNVEDFTIGCHLIFTQTILNESTEQIFKPLPMLGLH